MDLLTDGYKIPKGKFPLLDQISTYEKKPIVVDCFVPYRNVQPEVVEMIEGFFQHTSLKDALKQTFGISSPKLCDFINTQIFIRDKKKQIGLNLNYFLCLSVLYYVFLKQEKPNYDGFMKTLSNHHVLSVVSSLFNHRVQLQGLLNHFNEDQKIKILENTHLYAQTKDALAMFFQRDDYFSNVLGDLAFDKKNDLGKIHDVLAKHMSKIKEEDFVLSQEKHYPNLLKLKEINKEYSFVIPRTHHDLVNWGSILGHCIGSRHYADKAFKGQAVLLGVLKEDKLKYTLEIINGRIVQAQGVSGTRPTASLMKDLEESLQKAKIF